MSVSSVFKTATKAESRLDGSSGNGAAQEVSDFVTVQSFANFALMTGGISAAWHALQQLHGLLSSLVVPYVFALAWAGISLAMSWKELGKGDRAAAIFIAIINGLILASAVVGADVVVTPNSDT